MDITSPQAITRLTGTLRALSNAPGFGTAAEEYYRRLATAIATGLIPYIDGRDDILDRKITVERQRNDEQDNRLNNHEQRIAQLEQRISVLGTQVAAAQQAANAAQASSASRTFAGNTLSSARRVLGITLPPTQNNEDGG